MTHCIMDEERELRMLKIAIEAAQKFVERSKYYRDKFLRVLETNTTLKSNISRVVGSRSSMAMVIHGLESIRYNYPSRLRFALALQLRKDFAHRIEPIEVHKPTVDPVEDRAIEDLGCKVVFNYHSMIKEVQEPTLFFMPYADAITFGNFFEANWCPFRLNNQVILLANSFEDVTKEIRNLFPEATGQGMLAMKKPSHTYERLRYVMAIQKHVEEFEIDRETRDAYNQRIEAADEENYRELIDHEYQQEDPFALLTWYFFKLDIETDMASLLPSIPSRKLIHSVSDCVIPESVCSKCMDMEDIEESSRLAKEIKVTMKELEESEFYKHLCNELKSLEIQKCISRALGSEDHFQMVVYGLRSIELAFVPQYHLALALLLRQNSDLPIREIEIYTEVSTLADRMAMSRLGCKVPSVDERCRRRVDRPTLFFLYDSSNQLNGNLFEANFHPSQLNQMVVLGRRIYPLEQWARITRQNRHLVINHRLIMDHGAERGRYEWATRKYTQRFRVDNFGEERSPFSHLFLRFIDTEHCSGDALNALLPRIPLKEKIKCHLMEDKFCRDSYLDYAYYLRELIGGFISDAFEESDDNDLTGICDALGEYRGPSTHRRSWRKPPTGWMKLNFGVSGGGYGGVFHSDCGDLLVSYAGPVLNAGIGYFASYVEALRQGLRCLQYMQPVPKLIVEGDALPVIRWANRVEPYYSIPPPSTYKEAFNEIHEHMKGQVWAFVHVYDEANVKANEMANKGAELHEFRIWEH